MMFGTPRERSATSPIGGVTVKGYVDRVFHAPPFETVERQQLVIVDLKTGSRTPDSDLPLRFYACLIEAALGIRPQFGGYYKARDGQVKLPLVDLDHFSVELLG